jgi:hypothetical protein
VKISSELPRAIHRDLAAYAEVLAKETGQTGVQPAKLVAPMIARFMAAVRAFSKAKRATD